MSAALRITFDGASRGNPGAGSSAAVLWRGAERVGERAFRHPRPVTNNEAEYGGLIAGLTLAAEACAPTGPAATALVVEGDSKLIIEQVFGKYKCNVPHLQALQRQARELAAAFKSVDARWIPRERNGAADALCNRALDRGVPAAAAPARPFSAAPAASRLAPLVHTRQRTIMEQFATMM